MKLSRTSLHNVPAGVWILGFVSLLPLFMVTTLGTSALVVGLVEELAESMALIVKIFSGVLSDYEWWQK